MFLVLNVGSSSVKFKLIDPKTRSPQRREKEPYGGIIDHFQKTFHAETSTKKINLKIQKISNAQEQIERDVELILQIMNAEKVLGSKKLRGIVHRVVHGGKKYTDPIIINKKNLQELEKLEELAPLHNPYNIAGIRAAQKHLEAFPHIAVFDTGFYKTIPEKAFRYAVPEDWYQKFAVRKYGFHGTSHEYVVKEALKLLKKKNGAKIISCHLGNGCSITASISGKAVDTSMGFTPLEGLIMGTRSGDIDPGIAEFVTKKLKKNIEEITHMLNKESGLKAIGGETDMRNILAKAQRKNPRALLALEMFCYRIAKYIGAYTAVLGGLDALVFTAGIGENVARVREKVCKYLAFLNLKKKIFVIKTNEELAMAEKAEEIL
ncbi:MAG: acetate/propionate family kinase [Patescibacteria group bacterium]